MFNHPSNVGLLGENMHTHTHPRANDTHTHVTQTQTVMTTTLSYSHCHTKDHTSLANTHSSSYLSPIKLCAVAGKEGTLCCFTIVPWSVSPWTRTHTAHAVTHTLTSHSLTNSHSLNRSAKITNSLYLSLPGFFLSAPSLSSQPPSPYLSPL